MAPGGAREGADGIAGVSAQLYAPNRQAIVKSWKGCARRWRKKCVPVGASVDANLPPELPLDPDPAGAFFLLVFTAAAPSVGKSSEGAPHAAIGAFKLRTELGAFKLRTEHGEHKVAGPHRCRRRHNPPMISSSPPSCIRRDHRARYPPKNVRGNRSVIIKVRTRRRGSYGDAW